MNNTLFRQSDIKNPFETYAHMLNQCPVFWDAPNNIWAIYSYKDCSSLLKNEKAQIPVPPTPLNGCMNEYAKSISETLVRLSNPPIHAMLREITMQLYHNMQPVSAASLLPNLINVNRRLQEIDWVKDVCKKLPLLTVLKGFCFSNEDIEFIIFKIGALIKIMLPNKTTQQIGEINEAVNPVYLLTEKHIVKNKNLSAIIHSTSANGYSKETVLNMVVANLIGLMIQGYDAERGVLSNSLLQALYRKHEPGIDYNEEKYFEKFVIETLRYDPPPHNTRRVLTDDIVIGNAEIKKGQTVLLVLAAANRDPAKFERSNEFNISRGNNSENLTFGVGMHACVAKYLSTNMAVETLSWLFGKYKHISLNETEISYEPLINVRLPKEMIISLS